MIKYFNQISTTICIIFIFIILLLPIIGVNISECIKFIDNNNIKERLSIPVSWSYYYIIIAIFLIVYLFFLHIYIKNKYFIPFLFIPIYVFVFMVFFSKKIERYTQGAYIDYCKNILSKEDANQVASYLKSYAIFFYSNRTPFINKEDSLKHLYYLYNDISKDVYFFTTSDKKQLLDSSKVPENELVYDKYGFSIFKRDKKK